MKISVYSTRMLLGLVLIGACVASPMMAPIAEAKKKDLVIIAFKNEAKESRRKDCVIRPYLCRDQMKVKAKAKR